MLRFLCSGLLFFVLVAGVSLTHAQIPVVVPNDRTSEEGDASGPDDFAFTPFRLQFIYESSQFASLPESHGPIIGLALRPDAGVTEPQEVFYDDLEIRLSTTDRTPDNLQEFFQDNIGDDETLVFEGELELSTEATGPPSGPRGFDYLYTFSSPFDYDPSQGNLLLDANSFGGQSVAQRDDQDSEIVGLYSGDPLGEAGDFLTEGLIIQFLFEGVGVPGDFDGNGLLEAADIDLLSAEVKSGNNSPEFDLNGDNLVDREDRAVWVTGLKNTYFGDANLDGEFNSGDFVEVFVAGRYETGEMAGWAQGDWDGDMEFGSGDFVAAFTDGGYETGPRPAAAAVPEPGSLALAGVGLVLIGFRRVTRRRV